MGLLSDLANMSPEKIDINEYIDKEKIIAQIKLNIGFSDDYKKKVPISQETIKERCKDNVYLLYASYKLYLYKPDISYSKFKKSKAYLDWRAASDKLDTIEKKLKEYEENASKLVTEIDELEEFHFTKEMERNTC